MLSLPPRFWGWIAKRSSTSKMGEFTGILPFSSNKSFDMDSYGLLESKQSLCDLCATTTSALKVGVMTVHNIITFLGLSAEIKSLPPFPAPSRPPWHFSIFMMKSPSFLNRSEAWAKPLRQSQLDGEWLPCVENCEKCFHLQPFWLHNLQKPSESYLTCPTLSNWRWRKSVNSHRSIKPRKQQNALRI